MPRFTPYRRSTLAVLIGSLGLASCAIGTEDEAVAEPIANAATEAVDTPTSTTTTTINEIATPTTTDEADTIVPTVPADTIGTDDRSSESGSAVLGGPCDGSDLVLDHRGGVYNFTGVCGNVVIKSDSIFLAAEEVAVLTVEADGLVADVDTIGALSVTGNSSVISWTAGAAASAVENTGGGNVLAGPVP